MPSIPHEADGKQKLKHFLLQKRYAAGLCNSVLVKELEREVEGKEKT